MFFLYRVCTEDLSEWWGPHLVMKGNCPCHPDKARDVAFNSPVPHYLVWHYLLFFLTLVSYPVCSPGGWEALLNDFSLFSLLRAVQNILAINTLSFLSVYSNAHLCPERAPEMKKHDIPSHHPLCSSNTAGRRGKWHHTHHHTSYSDPFVLLRLLFIWTASELSSPSFLTWIYFFIALYVQNWPH